MKLIRNLLLTLAALTAGFTPAFAQSFYAGSQTSTLPNYSYPAQVFTAIGTGSTQGLGGLSSGIITASGTGLTTATFAIQGSSDGGITWFALPLALYPTTTLPITTTAVTETFTATAHYVVNLAGLTNYRFVVSGTFTATNISLKLTGSSNKGYL